MLVVVLNLYDHEGNDTTLFDVTKYKFLINNCTQFPFPLKKASYQHSIISQVQDGKPSELQIARFGWKTENGWKIHPFKSHIINERDFHPNVISVVLEGLNIQLHLT